MANNNYPQITSVTSEALQAQIRSLLPSQEGFGTDLMAQNVIVPVIDLTSAAEGSTIPQLLQTALSFGSQTEIPNSVGTNDVITNTGFYRVFGVANVRTEAGFARNAKFTLDTGLATKDIWGLVAIAGNTNTEPNQVQFDFVVFLNSGEKLTNTLSNDATMNGSTRQIADVNGVLVNPSGFNPQ